MIPPSSPKSPFSPTRSELFLNKPLPAKPLPETPTEEYSAMWSDTSDSENESNSTVDSVRSPTEPRNSTESYPIFVSSGSDDFSDLVDHPTPDQRPHLSLGPIRPSPPWTVSRTDSIHGKVHGSSTPVSVSLSEAQYGRPSHWSQTRTGTNHYFREKKWDFFPELATPSALQASGRLSPGIRPGKTRKKDGRLNLAVKRRRWHSLDRAGLGLAYGVRDSIKTYMHRTLSKDSTENKAERPTRPTTAPVYPPFDQGSFQRQNSKTGRRSSAELTAQLRAMSLSTVSMNDMPESPVSIRTQRSAPAPRQKHLAVPMSPYQKYGSSIWESPKKSKRRNVQLPRYSKQPADIETWSASFSHANPTPPLSPPFKMQLQQNTQSAVRVLQDGTSHVLVAIDEAKRKIIESRDERRRAALKSQIRLVGPVNPHAYLNDPWD